MRLRVRQAGHAGGEVYAAAAVSKHAIGARSVSP